MRRAMVRPSIMAVGCALALVALPAGVAQAHDPIILTPDDVTPEDGPLLVDGTISFAVYAVVGPGSDQAFRAQFVAGDTVDLTALIPDQAPERGLADDALPRLSVVRPDGTRIEPVATQRESFTESFTGDAYISYLAWSEPAQPGVYGLALSSDLPARVTIAIGTSEEFGTAVDDIDNRDAGLAGVRSWFESPPDTSPNATSVPPATTSPTSPVTAPETTAPETTARTATPETTVPTATVPASTASTSDTIVGVGEPEATVVVEAPWWESIAWLGVPLLVIFGGVAGARHLLARRRRA